MKNTKNLHALFSLKKAIALLPMVYLFALQGQESGFGYGAVLGIGQATIKSNGLTSPTAKVSFAGGVTSSYKFNRFFGLTLDISAVSKGAKATGSESGGFPTQTYKYEEKYSMIDVEVPLMLKTYFGNDKLSINVLGGAGMNFNIFSFSDRVYENGSYNADHGYTGKQLSGINATNFSYTVGVGLTAKANENYYFIHLRTNGPLSSLGTINGNSATHNYFNLTFGYLFY